MGLKTGELPRSGQFVTDVDGRLVTDPGNGAQFAPITAGAAGDVTVVAAGGAGVKIRVHQYTLILNTGGTVQWFSNPSAQTKPLSGPMTPVTGGGAAPAGGGGVPLFETNANESLVLNLAGAAVVGGHVTYTLET